MAAGQINIQPQGLLGFLQAKNGGRYPQVLADFVQGTWDLRDNYEQTNPVVDRSALPAYANGANEFIRFLGDSEQWLYVIRMSWVWVPANAADTFVGYPAIFDDGGSTTFVEALHPVYELNYPAATADLGQRIGAIGGFWLPPGWEVGIWKTRAVSAGAAAFSKTVRFVAYAP